MAEFSKMALTTKGLALQSKAQTGVQLNFTKVQFGDGALAEGESILNITSLKNSKMTTTISSNKVISDGTSQIRTILSNSELTQGFYLREVGVFAQDPDEGEILYAYTNSGEYADFIPAGTGNTIVENTFDLIVIVGNASNVTAVIPSGGYVSHQDWEEKNQELDSQMADNAKNLKSNFINVLHPPDILEPMIPDANYADENGNYFSDSAMTIPATDNTDKFQNIINWVCSNGYPIIKIPNGNYFLGNYVKTPEAFKQPTIIGDNSQTTRFKYNNSITNGIIIFKGGSGSIIQSSIQNIAFDGLDTTYAIEFQGCCGMKALNCDFGKNLCGILFHNKETGEFTELCVGDNCNFQAGCHRAIEYKKDGNRDSFHGSGLVNNCNINQLNGETEPKILIGTGCKPYNAPLNIHFWIYNEPIVINNSSSISNFYGMLTFEILSNIKLNIVSQNSKYIYFNGFITSNNEHIDVGRLIHCYKTIMYSDGSIDAERFKYKSSTILTTGNNSILYCEESQTLLVEINVRANYYDYSWLAIVYKPANSSPTEGTITILSKNRSFNQSGYGDFTLSFNSYNLILTNNNYPVAGVSCTCFVTQIGKKNGQW